MPALHTLRIISCLTDAATKVRSLRNESQTPNKSNLGMPSSVIARQRLIPPVLHLDCIRWHGDLQQQAAGSMAWDSAYLRLPNHSSHYPSTGSDEACTKKHGMHTGSPPSGADAPGASCFTDAVLKGVAYMVKTVVLRTLQDIDDVRDEDPQRRSKTCHSDQTGGASGPASS